jgi:hypothetical protein
MQLPKERDWGHIKLAANVLDPTKTGAYSQSRLFAQHRRADVKVRMSTDISKITRRLGLCQTSSQHAT